ncbi:hypothetical protein CTheo_736 [Ceratobasidium theobromae]|uniref:Uncharacterized protein n=1 Tax=Ceratobasidium theobromae TaxID=1582974 RepID=A0A5N5QVY6_9AGAM|nr:hypothetical protein CTheo_736 [Ceratobasidium theobromae]
MTLNTDFAAHVFVPNARSVGNSTGSASFSGKSEAEDLEELTQWCVNKVGNVECVAILVRLEFLTNTDRTYSHVHLVRTFQGYSHGSLLVSRHPVLPSPMRTYHVLLSYPLSPLPLLTFFHGSTYREQLSQLVRNPQAHILIIYGDKDQFTSSDNYQIWTNNLQTTQTTPGAAIETRMVPGADHFWRARFNRQMKEIISSWLQQHESRATST